MEVTIDFREYQEWLDHLFELRRRRSLRRVQRDVVFDSEPDTYDLLMERENDLVE